ncbi:MAG: hypothetical protein QOI64_150, partial [Solirubrobacteraceae bacterium]|nr:hypothetical protein [Solirubrobacteraceae bacterium]
MRTHTTAAILAITGLLALPAGALAGGWATVGLSSTPDGLAPGAPWKVDIEVLQHGRTPLDGVHPTVTIASADGSVERTFATRPGKRPGIHRASVTFPRAGRWTYVIDDGFTARHPYPAVQIGGAGAATAVAGGDGAGRGGGGGGGGLALDRIGLAALAAIAAAGLVLLPARLRSR